MTIGGTTSAKNAGTYNTTFTLKDTLNRIWQDGTTSASHTAEWKVDKKAVNKPYFLSWYGGYTYYSMDYDGYDYNILDCLDGNYDTNYMTASGKTTNFSNTGTYTATVTPKANIMWKDGTTDGIVFTFVINKVEVPIDSNFYRSFGSPYNSAWESSYSYLNYTMQYYISSGNIDPNSVVYLGIDVPEDDITVTVTVSSTNAGIVSARYETKTGNTLWYEIRINDIKKFDGQAVYATFNCSFKKTNYITKSFNNIATLNVHVDVAK